MGLVFGNTSIQISEAKLLQNLDFGQELHLTCGFYPTRLKVLLQDIKSNDVPKTPYYKLRILYT